MNRSPILTLEHVVIGLSLLGDRFTRSVATPLHRMYHELLADQITAREFERAVRVVIADDTWFPSPSRLIEAATASIDDQAASAWSEILAANREDRAHEIDTHARASLTDLGGSHMIQSLTGDTILRFRTAFLAEYARRARAARVTAYANGFQNVLPSSAGFELEVLR